MTSEAGKTSRRAPAPFELLAFTAAPVAGGLIVVELEGRFATAQPGRFPRRPLLVVELGDDRPRLELAPVRATLAGDGRWHSAYAIPAESFPGARFALGLRGTLLELPAPDEPDDSDRLTALAREANTLRRALEAAEAELAATSADLGAAVIAARDEALAESTDRITTLETQLTTATTAHEHALTTATTRTQAAEDATRAAEARAEEAALAAEARVEEAIRAADARAEEAALAADARVEEAVRAAEVRAEETALAADARVEEAVRAAEARAQAAEDTARAATSGTDVLRAELAEERERAGTTIAQLEAELTAAHRRADALRNAADAEARERAVSPPATHPLDAAEDATEALAIGDTPPSPAARRSRAEDTPRSVARHPLVGEDMPRSVAGEDATPAVDEDAPLPLAGEVGEDATSVLGEVDDDSTLPPAVDEDTALPVDDGSTLPLGGEVDGDVTLPPGEDETRPLAVGPGARDALTLAGECARGRVPRGAGDDAAAPLAARPATVAGRRARVVGPAGASVSAHNAAPRGLGPWIAVGALVLFAVVLLGLLFGFLA